MKYECHGHMAMDGENFSAAMARHKNGPDESLIRSNLKACADNGIGFFRDGGDKYMVSSLAKRLAPEYGIDYRTPIFAIHKKGYYGGIVGRAFESMNEFEALVREAKSLGADFIKIMISGILDFKGDGGITGPALSFPEIREAVDIAGSEGFNIMAHVNGADNMINALRAGIKSVEHGFWPEDEVASALIETGAVWVPTCSTVKNLLGSEGFSDTVLRSILEKQAKVLSEAYSRGALIASGSDSGAIKVPHGSGTLDEYAYLAGLKIDPARGNLRIAELF